MNKTFFQAIADKQTQVDGLTFEGWLAIAKSSFMLKLANRRAEYLFETLTAFYHGGGLDKTVGHWQLGQSPEAYATEQAKYVLEV